MQLSKDVVVLSIRGKGAVGRGQYSQLQDIARRYVGDIEKHSDDAILILFGVPESHSDDKERAIDAAGELRYRFPESRIGISLGDVDNQNNRPVDSTVHESLELSNAAEPGQTLINEKLYQLVKELLVCEQRQEPTLCYEITGISDELMSEYKPSRQSKRPRQKKRRKKSKRYRGFTTRTRQKEVVHRWWDRYVGHVYRSVVGIAIIVCILLLWYLVRC